jgi:plasmid stabilization system protein ParE
MKVEWTEFAVSRVTEIAEYISLDSTIEAERWVNKIFDKTDNIPNFTNRFRPVKESSNPNHKEVIFGNYRIIFKVTAKKIFILTVRNFKQILPESDLSSEL